MEEIINVCITYCIEKFNSMHLSNRSSPEHDWKVEARKQYTFQWSFKQAVFH